MQKGSGSHQICIMLLKQKSLSLHKNLALRNLPPLFNAPELLPSASDRVKLFADNFSRNSNLDDPGIPLPVFPSRSNLKQHIFL